MTRRLLLFGAFAAVASVLVVVAWPEGSGSTVVFEASYPEGPLYDKGRLYYAEMGADVVTVIEGDRPRVFFRQEGCGPTAIARYGLGFVVLCHLGGRVVFVSADGKAGRVWGADNAGVLLRNPNDVSADGRGGVYFSDPGTFSRDSQREGRILHLNKDGDLRAVADSLWYPNGVSVDRKARRVLVSEHMEGRVLSFGLSADGSLESPTTVARIADAAPSHRYRDAYRETGPDGLEVGPNGDLYVAVYGEGRIVRFGPKGDYRGQIMLPTRFSTNIAFAPDGSAVTTGAFDNDTPPFTGEVRSRAASMATRTRTT